LATGLNVPGGVGYFKRLEIVKKSKCAAIAISEKKIAQHLSNTYHQTGIWFFPEGAATLAVLQPAVDMGLIQAGDEVVTFNT